jgi:peptidoglycan/LPS O-acetylase OafA/YrhL
MIADISFLQTRKKTARIPELEIIKIIGFIMVIACHFWVFETSPSLVGKENARLGPNAMVLSQFNLSEYLPHYPGHTALYRLFNVLLSNGYQGVGIFFIISGLGLTLSFLHKPRFETWPYLLARFERVYLPYLFVAICLNVFYILTKHKPTLDWDSLALLKEGVQFTWFLFPLVQFYVLFPVLFLVVRAQKVSANALLLWTLMACFLWSAAVLFVGYNFHPRLMDFGLCPPFRVVFFRLSEPVYGMWLAFLFYNNRASFERWMAPSRLPSYIVLYIFGCFLCLAESNLHIAGYTVPLGQSICNLLVSASLFNLLFILSRQIARQLQWLKSLAPYGYEFYLVQTASLMVLHNIYFRIPSTLSNIVPMLLLLVMFNFVLAIATHHLAAITLRYTYFPAKQWFGSINQLASSRNSCDGITGANAVPNGVLERE